MEAIGLLIYAVFVILVLVVSVGAVAAWIHGLILAFRAHVILGIIGLFLEPAYIIFGVVKWITGDDLAQKIVDYFSE